MSAVWLAARGAVRRRRLQTAIIGLVVFVCTATIVITLSQLATGNPFDSAFTGQDGAHLVVAFDSALVSDARLEQTAHQPGVRAAGGPFAEATVNITRVTSRQP